MRELICERVELIQSRGEELSLDELAEQLSGEKVRDGTLIVRTVYGERTFRLSDITELLVDDGNGRIDTITHLLKSKNDGGKYGS